MGLRPSSRLLGLKGKEWSKEEGHKMKLEVWAKLLEHGDRREDPSGIDGEEIDYVEG